MCAPSLITFGNVEQTPLVWSPHLISGVVIEAHWEAESVRAGAEYSSVLKMVEERASFA